MKSPIKVLHVLLDDRVGGSHSRIFSIAEGLKEENIEYILALPDGRGEAHECAKDAGITAYPCELGTPHFIKDFRDFMLNIHYIYNFLPSIHSLIKIIERENIDIVHLNGILCLQGAIAAKFMRRPVVWHLLGTLFPNYFIRGLRPFIKFSADKVVNVSNATREYYLIDSDIEDRIIYEPVNMNVFNQDSIHDEQKAKLRKELGIGHNEIILGAVGNLGWVKGYENLIEAVAIIRKKYKRIKLLITGKILDTQMEYYSRLKKITSSFGLDGDVRLLGWRTDIPEILSIMDIFILPSLKEGTPISILVTPGDAFEIALSILNLLESTKMRYEMGEKARETIKKKFSLESCVKAHKELYKEVLRCKDQ
jgi:glycosyltransferase involved in cell wall biosynthesis